MITVACVNWGNYLGRGAEYVGKLHSMVAQHLHQPFHFEVIEEAGDLEGWWVKVALFQPGRFKGRVLYLDLDSVIVGDLDELVEHKGIIDMHDWGWEEHALNSSVMVWDAGEHENIFTKFKPSVAKFFCVSGDQAWMHHLGGWQGLPAKMCRSYRYHSIKGPQSGCRVVTFHGNPKPHHITEGWVPQHWNQQATGRNPALQAPFATLPLLPPRGAGESPLEGRVA